MTEYKQLTFDEVEKEQFHISERNKMIEKLKPQAKQVLFYINTHGSITQKEALNILSCMRLPSRICEIKKAGFPIESKIVSGINQFGQPVHYAKYYEGGDEK
ncbi:MAG: hypothetical protein J5958_06685 [Clostridia bacterium]|nr:hypothetical protein [Clostridia bacterium]